MTSRQPGSGALAAGAGGLLLLLVMFLPWFGIDASFRLPGASETVTVDSFSLNAWESFSQIDVLLAGTGGLALALVVGPERVRPTLALIVAGLAALSALLVVVRLIDPPELPVVETGHTVFETGRRLGAFFGLLCTAAIAWGANRAAAVPAPAGPAPAGSAPAALAAAAPAGPAPGRLAALSRADVEAACARPWRSYDRRLGDRYARYFEQHPQLRGGRRFSARDLEAALPPGWGELARAAPEGSRQSRRLSAKSSQTLALGLLGVAARREPSLDWLDALLSLPPVAGGKRRIGFDHTVTPELLGERPRQTSVDVLVEDPGAVLCIATKWREAGMSACTCRGEGVGPGPAGRCSRTLERRDAYWAAGAELLGVPAREPGAPCPLSPSYEGVRQAAVARALAGPERLGALALVYDAENPYFAGAGEWPGWPAALADAVERTADPEHFRFAAISWQELVPRLPLDERTRGWAAEKHGLG